ncbi:hypothetical protein [Candidatus Hamiltonella defensa]|nr:hypothetical protein [Candidatus Hamiltonella defensa]
MQPLKKIHLCVLKKYLAVAALSCAASVISVKSIAAPKNLDIHLTAKVPAKEFKLEKKKIELTMTPNTKDEVFIGKTDIKYLNAENVPRLKVKLVNDTPELKRFDSTGNNISTDSIGIESISINGKQLVSNTSGVDLDLDLDKDQLNSSNGEFTLDIISKSYEKAPEGNYRGTVTLQFDANI